MQPIANTIGTPPSSLPIYENLCKFIGQCIHRFAPLSRTNKGNPVTGEDDITEDLADFLESEMEAIVLNEDGVYKFVNQSKIGIYRTDIGVKLGRRYIASNRDPFCFIEAKRLPVPDAGNTRDEREYVIVDRANRQFRGNGGIQRFKDGKHADNLPFSIMMGYIQSNDAPYWLLQINGWINDLANEFPVLWNSNDCLQELKSENGTTYVSQHWRGNDLAPIILRHFWIAVSLNDESV